MQKMLGFCSSFTRLSGLAALQKKRDNSFKLQGIRPGINFLAVFKMRRAPKLLGRPPPPPLKLKQP